MTRLQQIVEHCAELGGKFDRFMIGHGVTYAGRSNQRLKAMRAMFEWGVEEEECENNPAIGVRKHSYQTDGDHQWTDEQMAQYRAFYRLGTEQRVAIDLVSYTSCRREDVVRFGPQHRRNERLTYRPAKNEHRNPIDLDIPVHPSSPRASTPSAPNT